MAIRENTCIKSDLSVIGVEAKCFILKEINFPGMLCKMTYCATTKTVID